LTPRQRTRSSSTGASSVGSTDIRSSSMRPGYDRARRPRSARSLGARVAEREERGTRCSTTSPAIPCSEHESGGQTMGIGVSVFLIAVGAILTWAVEWTAEGINLDTVGIILMVVGAL